MLRQAIERLQSALSAEFERSPKLCTLATVDDRGGAAARTVVCRRVTMTGDIFLFSDARSDKVAQVRRAASAEVVFWLSRRREQFRIKGVVTILDDPELRRACWAELSAPARAMYLWPAPGTPREEDAASFPREVEPSHPVPDPFAVLVVRPGAMELLDLKPHPHDRRRWRASAGWREERVNP